MRKMMAELRVKIASLSAESRIIRRAEQRSRLQARIAEAQIRKVDGHQLSHRNVRVLEREELAHLDPATLAGRRLVLAEATARALAQPVRSTREALVNRAAHHRDEFGSLQDHRRRLVGREARVALLAYAYLRGRPYSTCEQANTREAPPWAAVYKCAERFGGTASVAVFRDWVESGVAHLALVRDRDFAVGRLAIPAL